MVREKLIFKVDRTEPIGFGQIFGSDYLDDYDLNESAYVTRSGGIVSRIDSKTGTGAYFEQTTLADRPTWELNQINGKNVLRFDGVSDYMVHPSSTAYYNFIHDGSGACVITVYKSTLATTTTGRILNNTLTATTDKGVRIAKSSSDIEVQATSNGSTGLTSVNANTSTVGSTQFHSSVTVFDQTNGTTADKLYNVYDGTTNKNNVTANAVPSGNATYDMELGKLVNNTAQYFKGDIARIIIATAIPTATQLTQIQERLEFEYGTFPI